VKQPIEKVKYKDVELDGRKITISRRLIPTAIIIIGNIIQYST
jgi:hypothetical protein